MAEMTVSTYRNARGRTHLPNIVFDYMERDDGNSWQIRCSEDIAYIVRYGDLLAFRDVAAQERDADYMAQRLECAALICLHTVVDLEFVSRVLVEGVQISEAFSLAYWGVSGELGDPTDFGDWFRVFSQSQWAWLRRAAEDAHLALTMKYESAVFLYRAFEWLKKGLGVSWSKLGKAIDVPQGNIDEIKKIANQWDSGGRHAAPSGHKLYFDESHVPSWVHGIMHGIIRARATVDEDFRERLPAAEAAWPLD